MPSWVPPGWRLAGAAGCAAARRRSLCRSSRGNRGRSCACLSASREGVGKHHGEEGGKHQAWPGDSCDDLVFTVCLHFVSPLRCLFSKALKLPLGAVGNSLLHPFGSPTLPILSLLRAHCKRRNTCGGSTKLRTQMNEAGKRCLHVIEAQVREALLSAKAKTIGEIGPGKRKISLIARGRGQETQHDY